MVWKKIKVKGHDRFFESSKIYYAHGKPYTHVKSHIRKIWVVKKLKKVI
jgi:hypothetical protein